MTSFENEVTNCTVTFRRSRDGHIMRRRVKKSSKSSYKHVPHSEKPAHLVAKRNARERRRVETVNNAFLRLRRHVPFDTKHKRLSKVKTLRYAIDYIKRLTELIDHHDKQYGTPCCNFGRTVTMEASSAEQERPALFYRSRDFNTDTLKSYGTW